MSEKNFQEKVLRDLRKIPNCWVFKTNDMFAVGVPDILFCLNGAFCSLELKREGGEPTKKQSYTLYKIRVAGGFAKVVQPSEWTKVYKEILEIKNP